MMEGAETARAEAENAGLLWVAPFSSECRSSDSFLSVRGGERAPKPSATQGPQLVCRKPQMHRSYGSNVGPPQRSAHVSSTVRDCAPLIVSVADPGMQNAREACALARLESVADNRR